jgi:hypothetical protein
MQFNEDGHKDEDDEDDEKDADENEDERTKAEDGDKGEDKGEDEKTRATPTHATALWASCSGAHHFGSESLAGRAGTRYLSTKASSPAWLNMAATSVPSLSYLHTNNPGRMCVVGENKTPQCKAQLGPVVQ